MRNAFLAALNLSINAGYIILAVLLIRLVFRKIPKRFLCLLWGLAALRLVLPFSLESVLSLIPSSEPIKRDIIYSASPEIQSGIGFIDTAVNPVISSTFKPNVSYSVNPLQILTSVLSYVWLFGIAALILYAVINVLLLKKRLVGAVRYRDNIYQSEKVSSPFILGVIRPKIYIPFSMDAQSLDFILSHEKAHIKRGDHLIKPLGFIILSVYWFNPLVWLAYILLCRDIELACDERVIKDLSVSDRQLYADTLFKCGISRGRIAACPLAFGEVGIKERIKGVMSYKKPTFWVIIIAVIACIAVAVFFLTSPKDKDNGNSSNTDNVTDNSTADIEPEITDNSDTSTTPDDKSGMLEVTQYITSTYSFANWSDEGIDYLWSISENDRASNDMPVVRIDSTNELDSFIDSVSPYFTLEQPWDEVSSFKDASAEFTEEFFSSKTLFILYVWEGSSSVRHSISSVYTSDDELNITIDAWVPELFDEMMAGWFITVAFDKGAVGEQVSINTVINEKPLTSTVDRPEGPDDCSSEKAVYTNEEIRTFMDKFIGCEQIDYSYSVGTKECKIIIGVALKDYYDDVDKWAEEHGIPRDCYEFELCFGDYTTDENDTRTPLEKYNETNTDRDNYTQLSDGCFETNDKLAAVSFNIGEPDADGICMISATLTNVSGEYIVVKDRQLLGGFRKESECVGDYPDKLIALYSHLIGSLTVCAPGESIEFLTPLTARNIARDISYFQNVFASFELSALPDGIDPQTLKDSYDGLAEKCDFEDYFISYRQMITF